MLTTPAGANSSVAGGGVPHFAMQPMLGIPAGLPPAIAPSGVGIPAKVAQRIWKGEFVEMAELLPEKLGQADSLPSTSKEDKQKARKKRVASILQWVECFHTYIGVLVQQHPGRTQDLLAYASLVVHAARKYRGEGWATYDRNFRKKAAAHPGVKWGDLDSSLWSLAFCNAVAREHCALCMSVDHSTKECEDYDSPEEERLTRSSSSARAKRWGKTLICKNWNNLSCTSASCDYQHICLGCHQNHKLKNCPQSERRRFSPYSKERTPREGVKPPFPGKGSS